MTSSIDSCTPWIQALGAAEAAPGGGAAAGLLVAVGAALTRMVAGYSTGDKAGFTPSGSVAARMRALADDAGALAAQALAAAEEDSAASAGFAAAFRLPDDAARAGAVAAATREAARTSSVLGDLAVRALELLGGLGEDANPVVAADVAVAAAALGGALRAAAVNVEVNLAAGAGAGDVAHRERLRSAAGSLDSAASRADALVAAVRSRIASSGT